MIPHTIHQMYKTANNLPDYFQPQWIQSWKDNHPSWQYRFWTDSDLRKLAADKYPNHLPVFDSPQKYPGVMRGDLGRLMVLDQFGGVYVDLDYFSLRPLDPLLVEGRNFIGAAMPVDLKAGVVPQAFIASVPGHAILKEVMAHGLAAYVSKGIVHVPGTYGWYAFAGVYRLHQHDAGVYTSPPDELCPFSWEPDDYAEVHSERYLSADELRTLHPEAYAVHFWETGWGKNRRGRLDKDEHTPAFPPKPATAQEPEPQPANDVKPVPQKEWPLWANAVARRRTPGDAGVGDTVNRLLGKSGERFKRWFKRLTGLPCGCERRQAEWNKAYPYTKNFGPEP